MPAYLKKWLSPKTVRFWAVIALLLYTLGGFFLLPSVLHSQLEKQARETLGRELTIGKVHVNPYVLSLQIDDFSFHDVDGERLFGFDQFFVNLQSSSLFRWAWTLKEIRLDGGHLFFERFALEDTRLSRLMADIEAAGEADEQPEEEASGLPRLLIHQLSLNNGSGVLLDQVPESPVQINMGPVSVAMQDLNTLPDSHGQQNVDIRFEDGSSISWQGTISLAPLDSEGHLTVSNSRLDRSIAYLKAMLPLSQVSATLDASTRYSVKARPDGDIEVALDELGVQLGSLRVTGLQPDSEFLSLESLQVSGGTLRYPEQRVSIEAIELEGTDLQTWLDADGNVNLLQLLPAEATGAAAAGAEDSPGWDLSISRLALSGTSLGFEDRQLNPAAGVQLSSMNVEIREISNLDGQKMPILVSGSIQDEGQFEFDGLLSALPQFHLTGQAKTESVPLALAQPWVQESLNIEIERGQMASDSSIALDDSGQLVAEGTLSITDLGILDTVENEQLLAWQQMDIDQYEADLASSELKISLVHLEQMQGRIEINADRSTNLDNLLKESESSPEPADFSLLVGGIELNDGVLDFSDLSLPLHFSTRISGLEGTVSTINSQSQEPANIRLEGQVDDYGLARINGTILALDPIGHTDINMEFRNLLMSRLSPYTVEFAGREIAEGKMDLNLGYRIEKAQLQGSNEIVMSDLLLGNEVESPNAVSLPLGLAVALLTDSNGVIDIDLPVQGDINDPEFKIGGVVWQAFVGLVTKIVTAPFRLLGNLIGVDSEDFGQFEFLAGRYDLTPPELEKVAPLQQALQQRPELAIEISGVYDPAIDVPKLKFYRLRASVLEMLEDPSREAEDDFDMLDVEILDSLQNLYRQAFPEADIDVIRAAHMNAPEDDPEGEAVLDALAFAADLRDRLLEIEQVSQADLDELANRRARSVQEAFLSSGTFDATRISIAPPVPAESEDGEWLTMELGVASN
jgi:uncharacterized protein involved in outer membrane biogenesis